jgi:DNA-binding LacI/PurR family transcriptional regulator
MKLYETVLKDSFGGDELEKKAITIYDIAKEAGVSPSTVSRVLTGSTKVSQLKREKVNALIDKYQFKPNALARKLSEARTYVIGIITADIRNPFYAALFVACEEAANEKGYTLMLCNSLNEKEKEDHYLEKLEEQRVDAIILVGGRVDELVSQEAYIQHVNKISNTTPIVVTGKLDGADCYQVNIDQAYGMQLVMEHLFGLGHKKIALIGGDSKVKSTFEKRQRYLQLLDRQGIKPNPLFMCENGSYDFEGGYAGMNKIFEEKQLPTAVIAINDFAAMGIMRSIGEHHYKVPEDISLISFDNTYVSDIVNPKLTTVDYHYEEYGEKLIDVAISLIERKEVARIQHVKPQLMIKKSCARVNYVK